MTPCIDRSAFHNGIERVLDRPYPFSVHEVLMKLWLISQDVNNDYETYSDAVVAAITEEEARNIHPGSDEYKWDTDDWYGIRTDGSKWNPCDAWASPAQVKAEYIGEAKKGTEAGVVCSSFHAG